MSSLANQIIVPRSIPPVFLTKNHLPLHVMPRGYKGGCVADFEIYLFVVVIRCKQIARQPLRRLTPSAPLAQWRADYNNKCNSKKNRFHIDQGVK